MKVREGFMLRDIGEQPVVLAVGAASKVFNGMIKLNSSGKYLWEKLQNDVTEEELVEALMEKYDVSKEDAAKDVKEFIGTLKGAKVIDE